MTDQNFETSLDWVLAHATTDKAGLYGPTSAMWLVMRENMATLGALSAVLLQVAHPAIAAAGAHGSRMRGDFAGRTSRTFAAMYAIIFGDRATAAATIRRIHDIHAKVKRDGPGQSYRASDPELLFWVLATLIDSSVRMYELVAQPLSWRDREDYYADMKLFGAAMGIPPEAMPVTWHDFSEYFDAMVNGDRLRIGDTGRLIAHFIVESAAARCTGSAALATGMLPARWREAYGLPWGPKEQRNFTLLITSLRVAHRVMPGWFRYCPAYHQALVRAGGAPRSARTFFASVVIRASTVLRLPWALAAASTRAV